MSARPFGRCVPDAPIAVGVRSQFGRLPPGASLSRPRQALDRAAMLRILPEQARRSASSKSAKSKPGQRAADQGELPDDATSAANQAPAGITTWGDSPRLDRVRARGSEPPVPSRRGSRESPRRPHRMPELVGTDAMEGRERVTGDQEIDRRRERTRADEARRQRGAGNRLGGAIGFAEIAAFRMGRRSRRSIQNAASFTPAGSTPRS